MARLTIEQRIQNARQRQEETVNLSFSIDKVKELCEKLGVDPRTEGVGVLVEKILDAVTCAKRH